MALAQAKVSESMTLMVESERSGNKGSKGESSGYMVRSMKVLDNEAPGVVVVMCEDLLIVSSQILRRVARSGSMVLFCDCGSFDLRKERAIDAFVLCWLVEVMLGWGRG